MTALVATARSAADDRVALIAPQPGLFRRAIHLGDVVRAGSVLGHLEVLGHAIAIVAPDGARGVVVVVPHAELARPAVDHGATLVVIDPHVAGLGAAATTATAAQAHADGLVFRAPTSGRFYGRPTPDKPPFCAVGAELHAGSTVCLLEVMKTFNRVTYGGGGLPERARVRAVLVADGADVNAGEPLLALEAI